MITLLSVSEITFSISNNQITFIIILYLYKFMLIFLNLIFFFVSLSESLRPSNRLYGLGPHEHLLFQFFRFNFLRKVLNFKIFILIFI